MDSLIANWECFSPKNTIGGHTIEQILRRRIAHAACMFEHDQTTLCHFAARGGAVMVKHIAKRLPKEGKILFRKAGAFPAVGKRRRDKAVGTIEAVRHYIFAPHRANIPFTFRVFLRCRSHSRNRYFLRQYGRSEE